MYTNNTTFRLLLIVMLCAFVTSSIVHTQTSDYLSGQVFSGNKGNTSTPISGVTVKLYASNNEDQLGSQIASTSTDKNGQYSLLASSGYEYYNIVETDPQGYKSVGASSVDGSVINSNRIRYSIGSQPLSDQTKTGNNFWDKPEAPANNPPVAVDDYIQLSKNAVVMIYVLTNDSDPDGDNITIHSTTTAFHGSVAISGNQIIYTPDKDYTGTDQFEYTIIDGNGGSDRAYVYISVIDEKGIIIGRIWHDQNQNGLQDAGEPGIPNVTIYLFDQKDNLLASLKSSQANGTYAFSNLNNGDYYLIVKPPSGFSFTAQDQGQDDSIDSDADVVTGRIDIIQLASEIRMNLGAGLIGSLQNEYDFGDAPSQYPSASHLLGGPYFGWLTGAPDAESGMQHSLDATGDDADGYDDEIGFKLFTSSSHVPGGHWGVDLDITINQVSGFRVGLWADWNNDGDFSDPQEEIFAYSTSTAMMSQTFQILAITANIPSSFTPGNLFVRLRIVEGEQIPLTPDGQFGRGEIQDHVIQISQGDPQHSPGERIFGRKWNDENGDGIWDATEPSLANWTIWLDANQNSVEDAGDQYDVTDATGNFEFKGLSAGQYIVGEKMQTGWIQTWPGGTGTQTITVDPTKPSIGILFGNQQTDPDSGTGAVKWNQSPLFDIMSEDTACYQARRETSIRSDTIMTDNWFCFDPQPVTAIRWWGAYANWDSLNPPEIIPDYFHIGIWIDQPDEAKEFSHPGELIQEWYVTYNQVQETTSKSYFDSVSMEKPETAFQYTFNIEKNNWFYQKNKSDIYWIHIAAVYEEIPEDHHWGWLTREHYFHEDAVRMYQPKDPHPGSVFEDGIPIGSYWDMAFVLYTTRIESDFDFGDAPDKGYGTTIAKNGPQHLIDPNIYLGTSLDTDSDGQPHPGAIGDDYDGSNDEDGVRLYYTSDVDSAPQLQITVSHYGYLNGWMDLDQNGHWQDPEDHILNNIELESGTHLLDVPAFENLAPGSYMSRFRFSIEPYLWIRGFTINGEVEDYWLHFNMTNIIPIKNKLPLEYQLYQNYPNPFNPKTTIAYDIPEKEHVKIRIFNLAGQEIAILVDREQAAGHYQVTWQSMNINGISIPSGVYICTLKAGNYYQTIKLIYLK